MFTRRARGIELTAAGAEYTRSLGLLLDQLALATERVRRTEEPRRLTIATTPSFAARWLMSRLSAFLELQPEFDVRLSTSNAVADFARQDIDVAVRYGTGRWPRVPHGFYNRQRCGTVANRSGCSPAAIT